MLYAQTRVNKKTVEARIGEKFTKADSGFTREITGFDIAEILPINHKTPIKLIFIQGLACSYLSYGLASAYP